MFVTVGTVGAPRHPVDIKSVAVAVAVVAYRCTHSFPLTQVVPLLLHGALSLLTKPHLG